MLNWVKCFYVRSAEARFFREAWTKVSGKRRSFCNSSAYNICLKISLATLLIRAHLNQALYIYIYIFWISKNKIFSNRKTFESSLCSLQVAIILEFNVEHTSILHIQSLVVIGCCWLIQICRAKRIKVKRKRKKVKTRMKMKKREKMLRKNLVMMIIIRFVKNIY